MLSNDDLERLSNHGLTDDEMFEEPADGEQLFNECISRHEEDLRQDTYLVIEEVKRILRRAK